MGVPMPTTEAEKAELEEWVIQLVLGHVRGQWVEEQIVAAIEDPSQDPVAIAKRVIGTWGSCGPERPHVDSYSRQGFITVRSSPGADMIMQISLARIVDFVRRKHSPQLSLF